MDEPASAMRSAGSSTSAAAPAGTPHARLGTVPDLPANLGTFDTVLLLGNKLGLLGSAEAAPAVLDALARVTGPGARIVASGVDPYLTDDADHLAYHRRNRTRGRLPGPCRIRLRHGTVATDWFDYLRL